MREGRSPFSPVAHAPFGVVAEGAHIPIWNLKENPPKLTTPMKTDLRRLSRSPAGMLVLCSGLAGCSMTETTPDSEPVQSVLLMPELDAVRRERLADISGRFVTPEGFQVEMVAENFRRVLLRICFTTSVAMVVSPLCYATASIDTPTEGVKFPSNCL